MTDLVTYTERPRTVQARPLTSDECAKYNAKPGSYYVIDATGTEHIADGDGFNKSWAPAAASGAPAPAEPVVDPAAQRRAEIEAARAALDAELAQLG